MNQRYSPRNQKEKEKVKELYAIEQQHGESYIEYEDQLYSSALVAFPDATQARQEKEIREHYITRLMDTQLKCILGLDLAPDVSMEKLVEASYEYDRCQG